jgi:hypothetical protein
LADLVFGKRTSGHFGGNIQDDFFLTMFRHGLRGFFSQSESKLQGRQPTRVSLSGTL